MPHATAVRLLLLLLLASLHALARAEPQQLGVDLPYSVLFDASGKLTVEQVAALPEQEFRRMGRDFVAGFTRSAVWMRIPLPPAARDGSERYLEIMPPYLDSVRLYEPSESGWRLHEAGDMAEFSKRDIRHRTFVFRIRPQDGRPLLVRVETSSAMTVSGALWQPAEFAAATEINLLRWGIYFGVVVVSLLFLFGTSLLFRSRKLAVLSISSALIGEHTFVLQGFPAQLWEHAPPALLSGLVGVGACLTVASGIYVIRVLLTKGRNRPSLDRLLLGFALLCMVAAISVPLDFYDLAANLTRVLFLAAACIGLVLALRDLKEGRAHQYLLAASLVYLVIVTVPSVLMAAGMLAAPIGASALWYAFLPYSTMVCITVLLEIHQEYELWKHEQTHALQRAHNDEKILEEKVRSRTAELAAARERLQSALDSERRVMLEQQQFVSMVSHEIRTPLAILDSAAINLSAVPPRDSDELDDRVAQMRRAIQRLNHLVDNCLAGDRMEHGAFDLHTQTIDVAGLVQEAAQLVQWSTRHSFEADMSDAPPIWRGDPTLIRIALSNLIDNAVKYSSDGVVQVVGRREGERLTVAVSNAGTGIASQDMERIFEKYVRVERRGHGVGLGLFVSRKIAQLHNGDITAYSKPNDVTTFCLKLGSV